MGVHAQTGGFNLEAERNWDTYGVGGTCIYGTQDIFVGDVDGDAAMEIVTGGFAYYTSNGSRTKALLSARYRLRNNNFGNAHPNH